YIIWRNRIRVGTSCDGFYVEVFENCFQTLITGLEKRLNLGQWNRSADTENSMAGDSNKVEFHGGHSLRLRLESMTYLSMLPPVVLSTLPAGLHQGFHIAASKLGRQ